MEMAGTPRCQLLDPLHHFGFPAVQIFKEIFLKETARSRSVHSGTTKKALCDFHSLDPLFYYHSGTY
jgi:hypothetical protein